MEFFSKRNILKSKYTLKFTNTKFLKEWFRRKINNFVCVKWFYTYIDR